MLQRLALAAASVTALSMTAASFAACGRTESAETEREPAPVPVTCEPARATSLAAKVSLRGVVAVPPELDAMVAAMATGRILEVKVREGDHVHAGDTVALIDDPDLVANDAEAKAARSAAKANLVAADATYERAKHLFEKGLISRHELEEALAKREAAAADLATARAKRELASDRRARARVTAPITGTVIRLVRKAGELVDGTPDTPIVEIADPTLLELRADVPAATLIRVQQGAQVSIELDALPAQIIAGTIVFVSPSVDPATSLGVIRASIVPPAGVSLKMGLPGRIELEGAARQAIVVPEVAIRHDDRGHAEVVVCSDDSAEVRPVDLGERSGDAVEIQSGLEAGERVVTHHLLGLENGAAIAPQAVP